MQYGFFPIKRPENVLDRSDKYYRFQYGAASGCFCITRPVLYTLTNTDPKIRIIKRLSARGKNMQPYRTVGLVFLLLAQSIKLEYARNYIPQLFLRGIHGPYYFRWKTRITHLMRLQSILVNVACLAIFISYMKG